ncbi:hypothetical protein N658DRAFT_492383 [Parathielavia hyrcaniae]|uniref:Uncharacterized protein n=1 Tax=Parathielavia hyrcaniae TaxID=113614 RepID=A0AAN6Q953_9PEZI|nr:hypothetical protein N658DRAFT_492383 [Parathielavia hyrcaniae]
MFPDDEGSETTPHSARHLPLLGSPASTIRSGPPRAPSPDPDSKQATSKLEDTPN